MAKNSSRRRAAIRASTVAALLVALVACGDPSRATPTDAAPAPSGTPSGQTPVPDGGVASDPSVVTIDTGAIRGAHEGGAFVWRGIPYAAPPVAAHRWRPPQAAMRWNGVREAKTFGAECVQTAPETSAVVGGSEDCLTVNVWRPDGVPPPGGWPVMVFLHGGYNVRGSSSMEIEPGRVAYDGKPLVARNVVFVSLNYRLGALGWMAHVGLTAESPTRSSGNYGALDQLAALSWVKRNAAVFGADPARVLLFGQSAGATDTCTLVVSPLARGLFSRAVMHSGNCPAIPEARAKEAGAKVAAALGCGGADALACMRAKDSAQVGAAVSLDFKVGGFSWGPSIDGHVLPAAPAAIVAAGTHNHVALAIGVTAHEMTTLWRSAYPSIPFPVTASDHEEALRAIFGPTYADRVIGQYPASAYPSPVAASVAATSDSAFVCPARELARAVSRAQAEPVRRFYFSHVLASGPARAFGAGHGLDLFFAFAQYPTSFFMPTPVEKALSDSMIGYFTRFAATGDPNGGGAVAWPAYDATADSQLVLDDVISVGTKLREEQCDFWRSL